MSKGICKCGCGLETPQKSNGEYHVFYNRSHCMSHSNKIYPHIIEQAKINVKKATSNPGHQSKAAHFAGKLSGKKNITKYNKSDKGRDTSSRLGKINGPKAIIFYNKNSKLFKPSGFESKWEKLLFDHLKPIFNDIIYNDSRFYKGRKGGYRFDLSIPSKNLFIEVDGSFHRGRETKDDLKDKFAEENGWRVLRIKNSEVESNISNIERLIHENY